jgi:hypothetical protein
MNDFTLASDHKNPQKNYATRRAAIMTTVERWESGFDDAYFKRGMRSSVSNYQAYIDGYQCGYAAYARIRNSEDAARIIQWEAEQANFRAGKRYRVPYSQARKEKFSIPIEMIDQALENRPDPELNWKVSIALSALNVMIHENGMDFDEAVWATLKTFAVPRDALIEAYDDQIVTPYTGGTIIEFGSLSPQAQAQVRLP